MSAWSISAPARPVRLTASDLQSIGACRAQRRIFRRRWPKGVDITAESIAEARALGLRVGWLAWWPLTPRHILEALAHDPALDRALLWPGREAARAAMEAEREERRKRERARLARLAPADEDAGGEGAA